MLDLRDLASLDYNKSFRRSRGTLEDIFNALRSPTDDDWVKEEHDALADAEMVAKSLNMLINQLNKPTEASAATSNQSGEPERKFTIQRAWRDSKKHRVEFDAVAHTYKLHVGSKVYDVDTSVTSYIS